jgi:hypothetical protein
MIVFPMPLIYYVNIVHELTKPDHVICIMYYA